MAAKSSTDNGAQNETVNESIPEMDSKYSPAEFRAMGEMSWDDILSTVAEKEGGIVDAAEELGDGFVVIEKNKLVGKSFIILNVMFPESDRLDADGSPLRFAVVRIITEDKERYVFTDGGSGVYATLDEWCTTAGKTGGLLVRGGLRKSEYTYTDGNGRKQPAVTYYLNTGGIS